MCAKLIDVDHDEHVNSHIVIHLRMSSGSESLLYSQKAAAKKTPQFDFLNFRDLHQPQQDKLTRRPMAPAHPVPHAPSSAPYYMTSIDSSASAGRCRASQTHSQSHEARVAAAERNAVSSALALDAMMAVRRQQERERGLGADHRGNEVAKREVLDAMLRYKTRFMQRGVSENEQADDDILAKLSGLLRSDDQARDVKCTTSASSSTPKENQLNDADVSAAQQLPHASAVSSAVPLCGPPLHHQLTHQHHSHHLQQSSRSNAIALQQLLARREASSNACDDHAT